MAKPPTQVSFSILEREYRLACSEEDKEDLTRAVELLKEKMRDMQKQGNIIGGERIAVMTAIHLAHELFTYRQVKEEDSGYVDKKLREMQTKVATTLHELSMVTSQPPPAEPAPMSSPGTPIESVGVTRETE